MSPDSSESRPPAAAAGGSTNRFELRTSDEDIGARLDGYLAAQLADVSRTRIRKAIDLGLILVDGQRLKPSFRLEAVHEIRGELPPAAEGPKPQAIDLSILFEDDHLVIVDKPPGMVVHPAKGHWEGTLASALVHRFEQLSTSAGAARPGIVHRLDRDTSGVIVVAKSDAVHAALAAQFHDRTVQKEYLAIVVGRLDRDRDRIDHPIGPHPKIREKKALRADHPESRPAETFYEVLERFPGFALVSAHPKTGRTHQIRLHLQHVGAHVLCDRLYGGRARISVGELRTITRHKRLAAELDESALLLERQALHAHRIALTHPATGAPLEATAPLPADMQAVLSALRQTTQVG